jgi:hypothetical protein
VGSATLFVLSPDFSTVLYNSLTDTRTIEGHTNTPATSNDILQYTNGLAVSEDQQWLALMLNLSDVAVIPLVDGIPELEDRMVVDTTTTGTENSGRDIAFDAANNIHYVSSGQARYRVLAPGGHTLATTTWNGTDYDFAFSTVTSVEDDADFDQDGDVDGHDFLTWQRGLGAAGDLADGDADGDGFVDGDDLQVWRDQFGTGSNPPATAIPEPATWALAALAVLVCLVAAAPRRRAALARVKVTN